MLRLKVPKQAGSVGKRNIEALSDLWVSDPSFTVCSHIINPVCSHFCYYWKL